MGESQSFVKLVLFTHGGHAPQIGILTDRGVAAVEPQEDDPQAEMERVINKFAGLRPSLERLPPTLQVAEVQLLPPLPRPGKILCSTAQYNAAEGAERPPLLMTLKSAESVIGSGQTLHLPDVGPEWSFVAEAELGLVIRGPAKRVKAPDWRSAVFGYTCVLDVMAQGDPQFGRDFWFSKADTLGPLGPCVITIDELANPAAVRVRSLLNGQPAQDYSMADADYSLGEQVELATAVMTLNTGDVIACGTSRQGLRPLSDGDQVEVEIAPIGRLAVQVSATVGVAG